MKNKLNITNETNFIFEFEKEFQDILDLVLEQTNFEKPVHVDLLITDNHYIHQLAKEYYGKDKPTDILSFPFDWSSCPFLDHIILGEIVMSYEKIIAQSQEFNHSLKREFCYLFTHGLFHLMGYDHQTQEEETIMNNHCYDIMAKMNINRKD